jgi:hypothetical protein
MPLLTLGQMAGKYHWLKVTGFYCFEKPTRTGGWQGAWEPPPALDPSLFQLPT